MDMTVEIAELRVEAESMMTDTCEVTRMGFPTGPPVFDSGSGMFPEDARTVIYRGECSLRVPGTISTGKELPSAGDVASILLAILGIPVGSPMLLVNDRVQFTSSKFNPVLVGLTYTVSSMLPASWVTKQRVTVELVVD